MGLYKKRAKSYILFVKYQTIKYHTLPISAYEQRERQYPRKQLLPAAGQTICRLYARKHGLTTKELFILDIIYFAQSGCTQAGICERLSATKQTVSAAIKKFWKLGYLSFEESKTDRRIRLVRFTAAGKEYVERIIPPAAQAENDAMAELSGEQQAELVRLTDLFSEQMRLKFQSINKNTL